MTTTELEAGADAVLHVAEKYGVAHWLSRDQLREIAAAVISAHDQVHADAAKKEASRLASANAQAPAKGAQKA